MARPLSGWRLPVLLALALATTLLTVQLVRSDADAQTGRAAATKRVKITIKCTLTRGSGTTPCRGTFKMSGGFHDSGFVRDSGSTDRGYGSEGIGARLKGKKGSMAITLGGPRLTHLFRKCTFAAGITVYGNSSNATKAYAGWGGGDVKGSCVKVKVRSRSFFITTTQSVALRK